MAMGDRIKRVRNFRKMTMKELGMAVGFDESSADVRIAQYENNSRKPKEDLLRKIAKALDVNYYALAEPSATYCAEDILFTLFELEAQGCGLHLLNVIDDTEEDLPYKRVAVCFNYNVLDSFMKEWKIRKDELMAGEITKDEYMEWKLNWPRTADDCGVHEPTKQWRKKE